MTVVKKSVSEIKKSVNQLNFVKMKKKTIKNVGMGLAVALMAAGTAMTNSIHAKVIEPLVGQTSSGVWEIIDPLKEGEDWICIEGLNICTARLKEDAVANPNGTYNESEVETAGLPHIEQFLSLK